MVPPHDEDRHPPSNPPLVEIEFTVDNPSYPFVGASAAADCRMELEEMIPRGDGRYSEFFSVEDADPEQIVDLANAAEQVEPRLVAPTDDGGLFEFVVDGGCVAVSLAEKGAIPRVVRGEDGEGTVVAEIPASRDAADIVGSFLKEYPSVEITDKREKNRFTPDFTEVGLRETIADELTDRERDVLVTAFEHGYYDWPRSVDDEDLAAELDLAPSAVAQTLRDAEHGLLSALFCERVLEQNDARVHPLMDGELHAGNTST